MTPEEKLKKASGLVCLFLLLCFYGFFLAHKVNLVTADLGRHIRNGEFVFQNLKSLTTNFYSYTEPSFSTTNHHWLSGVVFYLVFKLAGFTGLSLFFLILSLSTLIIFFHLGQKKAGFVFASLACLLVTPLLAERTEIRPEGFSYLLTGIFFWLLLRYKEKKLSPKWLFLLPLLEILWVNLHIYFFLGPFLIGIFLINEVLSRSPAKILRHLTIVFVLTSLATILNPFGLKGSLAPLTIFENYGYRLVENQPVWFIEKLISNPNFLIFKIVFFVTALSFFLLILKKRFYFLNFCVFLFFSLIAWLSIRNFTLFGFFTLPVLAANLSFLFGKRLKNYEEILAIFAPILIASFLIFSIIFKWPTNFAYWRQFGLGLESENSRSAEFFKAQKIQGPIFNNYDIGGYLIFHLFPEQKVFVDNRPEAYSTDFFQKIYVPMQENDEEWQKQDKIQNFNAIFFAYHDATPWGQNFLVKRVGDPQWAPVFVDQNCLIFLKRNSQNQKIIEKFEIPKSYFRVVSPS